LFIRDFAVFGKKRLGERSMRCMVITLWDKFENKFKDLKNLFPESISIMDEAPIQKLGQRF